MINRSERMALDMTLYFSCLNTKKSSAELSADEKNSISHRGKALKKVKEVFPILMKMR